MIRLILLLTITLVLQSCGTSGGLVSKSVSKIENQDFKQVQPVKYNSNSDYHDLQALKGITDDSLIDETIQRVPEPKLEVITNTDSNADSISRLSSLCYQKEFRSAFSLVDKMYRKYKKNAAFWNQVGSCYYLQNDLRKARLFYQKAIESKKNYAPPFNNIGAIHLKNGEYEKALAAFKKAEALSKNSLTPSFNLAQVYLNFGIIDKSQTRFEKIQRQKGGDPGVLNGLATTYLFQGKTKSAMYFYKQINPKYFERPEYGVNYAVALKLAGNQEQADRVIRSVDVNSEWESYYTKVRSFVGGQ